MTTESEVAERFRRDTADHVMTVMLDRGTHRNLRFGRLGDVTYHFTLTTWPGYLCVSGDMGTYVFARLQDMFCFFRGDRINPSYWAEKCVAVDRTIGITEHSEDAAREFVQEWLAEDASHAAEFACEFEDVDFEDPQAVRDALEEHGFSDAWELDWDEPTLHFLWCLHAIVWGIQQYDALKLKTEQGAA